MNISEDKGKKTEIFITPEENDSEQSTLNEVRYQMMMSLIQRLDTELYNNNIQYAPDDLQAFIKLHSKEIKKQKDMIAILKDKLKIYIVENRLPFINEYKQICQDDLLFNDYVIPKSLEFKKHEQPKLPPVGAEDMIKINKWIEENCRWNSLKKIANGEVKVEKKPPSKFHVGQLVGARDSERNWWASRILFVFEDPKYPYPWYYVHFEGWGDINNEWISSPYRVKNFNPRRDILKR